LKRSNKNVIGELGVGMVLVQNYACLD